jgi:four helix bundle protein
VHVLVHDPQLTQCSADTPGMLDYEKLDVYQCAVEHLAFVFRAIPPVPRGYAALSDQWRRAAMSIPLNIAEAVGKASDAERNNRYAIARGEAMECGAILDVVRLLEVVPAQELALAKRRLTRVVEMLSKLCR